MSESKNQYRNEVALITGANQGIGLQIARELAAKGMIVLVGSRDYLNGEAAAKTIAGDARALQLDVTDRGSIARAAERIRRELGRLDVLVNNAAISQATKRPYATVAEYAQQNRASNAPLDDVRAIWETNVFGALAVYQAVLPLLREAPQARVVNVSSLVGSLTAASEPSSTFRDLFGPGYAASKAGMNAMSLAMAIELESTNIKVNACSPGFTKTNLNDYQGTETLEQGAREAVRLALLGADGPSGTFSHAEMGRLPW